jgi:hypothetical protein
LKLCGTGQDIGDRLKQLGQGDFKKKVENYSKDVKLRMKDLPSAFHRKIPVWDDIPSNQRKKILESDIGKYLRDRNESRRQY